MLLDHTPPADGKKRSAKSKKKDLPPFNLPLKDDSNKENNSNNKENSDPNVAHTASAEAQKPKPASDLEDVGTSIEVPQQEAVSADAAPAPSAPLVVQQDDEIEHHHSSELRKRREEVERLQSEKREMEEMLAFHLQRVKRKDQETKAERMEKEKLQSEVSSLSATIDKLKERIDELERNLATAREEKAMEEDKSRHLAKLHAEQAHQHAALIAEEQKQHDRELAEERERVRRVEERLLESQEANAALISEVQEVHGEMKEMQESREAAQQLATITAVKDAFALQIEVQKKENETLTSQVDQLQRELFYTLALALKLNSSLMGKAVNKDVHALWELAKQRSVPSDQWSRWLSLQFAEVQQSEL